MRIIHWNIKPLSSNTNLSATPPGVISDITIGWPGCSFPDMVSPRDLFTFGISTLKTNLPSIVSSIFAKRNTIK